MGKLSARDRHRFEGSAVTGEVGEDEGGGVEDVKIYYSSSRRWLAVGILLAVLLVIGLTVGLP